MDAFEFSQTPRAERIKTALFLSDMQEVIEVAVKLSEIKGIDGEVTYYRDDGEELAVIWWDDEREQWLINMLRGSGA